MTIRMSQADAAWGVRNRLDGVWRGCVGNDLLSHRCALELAGRAPMVYLAERNPADVLAEELAFAGIGTIISRASLE